MQALKTLALAAATALVLTISEAPAAAQTGEEAAVAAVLASYRDALSARNLHGTPELFAPDSQVVEQGKVEGSYADYVEHHIGPELGHITSFVFNDYEVTISVEGDIALATETYLYRLDLDDGRTIERQGVATSALRRTEGGWRIVRYHSSSRAPRPPQ
ncbi:MAG: SgcJ/EcaC family oxidoreductase [Hydrogenophilaceae bacterium]|nr:SgcJ/EcaC family oxidoreductase [Hydrogenophilaceae bacterium]